MEVARLQIPASTKRTELTGIDSHCEDGQADDAVHKGNGDLLKDKTGMEFNNFNISVKTHR